MASRYVAFNIGNIVQLLYLSGAFLAWQEFGNQILIDLYSAPENPKNVSPPLSQKPTSRNFPSSRFHLPPSTKKKKIAVVEGASMFAVTAIIPPPSPPGPPDRLEGEAATTGCPSQLESIVGRRDVRWCNDNCCQVFQSMHPQRRAETKKRLWQLLPGVPVIVSQDGKKDLLEIKEVNSNCYRVSRWYRKEVE